jgi:tRNA nucleotidyltransferase/poly(A) polymerase
VRVLGPSETGDVEVATFRSDGAYVDGRRPTSVIFGTAEEDAARRDFTINGMFLDPIDGQILDFVGGRADLDAKILRAIGNASERFEEDKLRLIRAVRFAARFDLRIDDATEQAIRQMADQVSVVATERIAQELRKMLEHSSRATAMNLAAEFGLLAIVVPQISSQLGASDGLDWSATLAVLRALPAESSFPLALAALLWQTIQMNSHVAVDATADALKLANVERDRASWLLDQVGRIDGLAQAKASERKRLLAREGASELLALARAIAIAEGSSLSPINFAEQYLRDQPEGPLSPAPFVSGVDLIRAGLAQGPSFKRILASIYDAQLDGIVTTREEAISRVNELAGLAE